MPGNRSNRTLVLFLLSGLISSNTLSAQITPGYDLKFIDHLVKTNNYTEALFLLDSGRSLSLNDNDTVFYLRAKIYYFLENPDSSVRYYLNVTPRSLFFQESRLRAVIILSQSGNYLNAARLLETFVPADQNTISLKNLHFAAINLLENDLPGFSEWIERTDTSNSSVSRSRSNLLTIAGDVINHRKKSPLAAGLMSGIIPGSGKLYAGRKGDALSAFLTTAGFGLVTWESFRKQGLGSFRTIVFGSLFAFSYASNIYGSVLSVKISENQFKDNVKNSVLFNLNLSVSGTFGR